MLRLISTFVLASSILGCEPPPKKVVPRTPISAEQEEQLNSMDYSKSFLDVNSQVTDIKDRIDKFTNAPPEDDTIIAFGDFQTPKPPSWFWIPPRSQIVTCNYIVPAVNDGEHAVFSLTQFELGEGGLFTDNVTRWKSLFRTNDGAPVKPTFEVITANNHDVALAEFQGEYMGAGAAWHLKNHTLLVAEVREESGNIYFKLLGPTETVNAHRVGFINVLNSLRLLPNTP